jgi:hypothetical protein
MYIPMEIIVMATLALTLLAIAGVWAVTVPNPAAEMRLDWDQYRVKQLELERVAQI